MLFLQLPDAHTDVGSFRLMGEYGYEGKIGKTDLLKNFKRFEFYTDDRF
jgi:hypothetical protein